MSNVIEILREEIRELKRTLVHVDSYLDYMNIPYANMCSEKIREIMSKSKRN